MTTQEIIEGLTNILDYCRYHQDAPALREAIEMLKCSEIPNSSDERTDKRTGTHACDCISRQQAIDALMAWEEYSVWDEDCLKHRGEPYWVAPSDVIKQLPSAQPEIIYCRDCKHWHREIHNGIEYFNFSSCDLNHYGDGHNFYCADAERREE